MHPALPSTADGFVPRLVLFYAGIFIGIGVQVPFLPVWLGAKDLDAQWIGLVLALSIVVRLVAVPIASRLSDHFDAIKSALVIASVATAASFAALGLLAHPAAIVIGVMLVGAVQAPMLPFADVYALKGLAARGRAYGPVRLWGSVAFIAGTFGAGLLADLIAPGDLIWLMVVPFVWAAIASVSLVSIAPARESRTQPAMATRTFIRMPGVVAVAVASALIQASHAVYYGFSAIDWKAAGFDGGVIGALWGLGVAAEIALFAVSGRLPAAIGPTVLLCLGAAGGALRWFSMALDPPAAWLPVLQCLHGLSYGATHLGAVQYFARAAPERLGATAQGLLSTANGLAFAGAMLLAGVLQATSASLAYAAMALMALIGGAFAVAAHRTRRPPEQTGTVIPTA
jgi:PPP family 3-phenylpropionic acid transporter